MGNKFSATEPSNTEPMCGVALYRVVEDPSTSARPTRYTSPLPRASGGLAYLPSSPRLGIHVHDDDAHFGVAGRKPQTNEIRLNLVHSHGLGVA